MAFNNCSPDNKPQKARKIISPSQLCEFLRFIRKIHINALPLKVACAEMIADGTQPYLLPLKGRDLREAKIFAQFLMLASTINEHVKSGRWSRKDKTAIRAARRSYAHIRVRSAAKIALSKEMILPLNPELEPEFKKMQASSEAEAAELKNLAIGAAARKPRDPIAQTDRQLLALAGRLRSEGHHDLAEKQKTVHSEYVGRHKHGKNPTLPPRCLPGNSLSSGETIS